MLLKQKKINPLITCDLLFASKGFTLAEVMVTLGVVGVLAAILIPSIFHVTPSKNKVLFRKAYNTLQQAVSMMVNDDAIYPADQTNGAAPPVQLGFNYVYNPGGATSTTYYANNKFCNFLSDSLNMIGSASCPTYNTVANGYFTTPDGIVWTIDLPAAGSDTAPATQFPLPPTAALFATKIIIDVNGPTKGPNCSTDSAATSYSFGSGAGTALTRCSFYTTCSDTADRFIFGVRYDGKLEIGSGGTTDTCANNILSAPTDNTK